MDTEHLEEYAAMCDCPEVVKYMPEGRHSYFSGEIRSNGEWVERTVYPGPWYPSQREIQDWIYRLSCEFKLFQDFYYWATLTRQKCLNMVKDRTLEQLWLQFYMWREHEQVWDGDEQRWVDERAFGLIVE